MPLPLIPIGIAIGSAALGAILHAWATDSHDAWADKDVFNARMRDLQRLGESLNAGFAKCPSLQNDAAALAAWRGARDGFSRFYKEVGTLNVFSPSEAETQQAKQYSSTFYYWADEYVRRQCGSAIVGAGTNPSEAAATPKPSPDAWTAADYLSTVKWIVIGAGGLYGLKLIHDLFGRR